MKLVSLLVMVVFLFLGCDDRSQSMAVRCTAPEGPQRSGGGRIAVNLLREEAVGGEIYCELALL